MKHPIAEKFKSIQGEASFTGTPMAFLRFVGCSVGKTVCTHCDTDFDKVYPHLGGGIFTEEDLVDFIGNYKHVCFTGGEPLDRTLNQFIKRLSDLGKIVHIETSGTRQPNWLKRQNGMWWVQDLFTGDWRQVWLWLTVSPKPGYISTMIYVADEIKVIIPGLGDGEGWPTLGNALQWANDGKLVYLQPRNHKHQIDGLNMEEVQKLVVEHPFLRLSTQFHKVIHVR